MNIEQLKEILSKDLLLTQSQLYFIKGGDGVPPEDEEEIRRRRPGGGVSVNGTPPPTDGEI
jgi:hypothetical protein